MTDRDGARDIPLNQALPKSAWAPMWDVGFKFVGDICDLEPEDLFSRVELDAEAFSAVVHLLGRYCFPRWFFAKKGVEAGPACVYFVRCGRFVKIGHARRLDKRLLSLQLSNPEKLKVWLMETHGSQFLAYQAEKAFHRQFRSLHHRGEWFRLASEIVAYVRQQRRQTWRVRPAA